MSAAANEDRERTYSDVALLDQTADDEAALGMFLYHSFSAVIVEVQVASETIRALYRW